MKDAFSDLRTWGGPQAMNKNRKTSMSGESCAKPSGAPVKNGSTPRSPFRSDPPPAKSIQRPVSKSTPGMSSFNDLDLDSLLGQPEASIPSSGAAAAAARDDPFGNFADLSLGVSEPAAELLSEVSTPHVPLAPPGPATDSAQAPDNPFAQMAADPEQAARPLSGSSTVAPPAGPRAPPSYDELFGSSSSSTRRPAPVQAPPPLARPSPPPAFRNASLGSASNLSTTLSASTSTSASPSQSDFYAARPQPRQPAAAVPRPMPRAEPAQADLLSGLSHHHTSSHASGDASHATASPPASRRAPSVPIPAPALQREASCDLLGIHTPAQGSVAASLLDDPATDLLPDFLAAGPHVSTGDSATPSAAHAPQHSRTEGDFLGMDSPPLAAWPSGEPHAVAPVFVDDMFGDLGAGHAVHAPDVFGAGDGAGLADDDFFSFSTGPAAPAHAAASAAEPARAAAQAQQHGGAGFGHVFAGADDEASALRAQLAHLTSISSLYEVAAAVGVSHADVGQNAMNMWMKTLNSREIAKLRGQYDEQTVAWQYADDTGSDDE